MKSAKDVASQVEDKFKNDRQYPVGKAQQTILNALGISKCNGHSHAQQIFDALGVSVGNKRVGRKSVPVVTKNTVGGGFNAYGEGEESFTPANDIDMSAISEWME